jgi:hypothetical protein
MRFTYTTGDQPLKGYTIKRGLGRGGFGEVYHAVSDGGKEVALKLVQRNLQVELRGVSHCLNLKHTNLVALYDVREAETGDAWVVMEYVGGGSLDQAIANHPQGMPASEALAWLRGVCAGVGYLHERGIVHRDLKPGNVFVENGLVKIGDYGLSKFISASRRSGQTESIGTVHYMAPEVSMGRYNREVDLYALGIMLHEMLTGQVPFNGETPGEILMKHLTATPDLAPVPEAYRRVVGRLLEKDPLKRYPSVHDLLADLGEQARGPVAASAFHLGVNTSPQPAVAASSPVETGPYHSQQPAVPPDSASPQQMFMAVDAALEVADDWRRRYFPTGTGRRAVGSLKRLATYECWADRPAQLRNRLPSRVVLFRLLIGALCGVGVGLLVGGLLSIFWPHQEEAAVFVGLGAGFLAAGRALSRLLGSADTRLGSPLIRILFWALGLAFVVGGFTAVLVSGGRPTAAPGVVGVGVGLTAVGVSTYRLARLLRRGLFTRFLTVIVAAAGMMFLVGGFIELIHHQRVGEAAVVVLVGTGLLVAGLIGYRMIVREPHSPAPAAAKETPSVANAESSVAVHS